MGIPGGACANQGSHASVDDPPTRTPSARCATLLFHSLTLVRTAKRTPRIHSVSEKVTLLAQSARSTASAAKHPPESLCSTEQSDLSVHALLSTEGSSGRR